MVSNSLETTNKRVLLLEGIHSLAEEALVQAGFAVERRKDSLGEADLKSLLGNYSVLGVRSKTQVTREVLQANTHLAAVGCFCIGTDQVDLQAAKKKGVAVFNSPYSNTRSVAELVIAEIVALSRKLVVTSNSVLHGTWKKSSAGSHEVRGKKLGIVGYGHIGTQVSIMAEAMGIQVFYYDIEKKLPLGRAQSVNSLVELLTISDFVTLHVPDTPQTRGLMGVEEINKMKKGSYLLNLSRGKVVDLEALTAALEKGHLAGAAIDVYPKEPSENTSGFETPLAKKDLNVILTPHIGGSTEEAQEAIGAEVARSLVEYLKWGVSLGAVNFPHVSPAPLKSGFRLINVHKNVPGVLGEINSIVSAKGINIESQYLSTDQDVGYLVMDGEYQRVEELVEKINALPASIKTRVVVPELGALQP